MRRRSLWATLACLAAVAVLAVVAAPAQAVVGGTVDKTNTYKNVGMILWHDAEAQNWGGAGSCTLVKNDREGVVVATAAHVSTDDGVTPADVASRRVVFDPLADYAAAYGATPIPDDKWPCPSYGVREIVMHPVYAETAGSLLVRGYAKRSAIGPGREDIALMWLDVEGPLLMPDTGTPFPTAPIVAAGGLDRDLRSEPFVFVGYGLNDFVVGSARSWRNPNFVYSWTGRNYREVSVVSQHEAFADRYLMHTVSSSYMDSGGPLFDGNGTLVALCVGGGGARCEAPDYDYRLDTQSAQGFLREHGIIPAQ